MHLKTSKSFFTTSEEKILRSSIVSFTLHLKILDLLRSTCLHLIIFDGIPIVPGSPVYPL